MLLLNRFYSTFYNFGLKLLLVNIKVQMAHKPFLAFDVNVIINKQ